MRIIKFTEECIEEAKKLLLENYQQEKEIVKDLPEIDRFSKLDVFVKKCLGVAAYKDSKLVGFLCCYKLWIGAFCQEEYRGKIIAKDLLDYGH